MLPAKDDAHTHPHSFCSQALGAYRNAHTYQAWLLILTQLVDVFVILADIRLIISLAPINARYKFHAATAFGFRHCFRLFYNIVEIY